MFKKLVSAHSNLNLLFILSFQILVIIACLLNIPVVRQVFGFIFLVFFPGYIILRLLKLETEDGYQVILFSIALSVLFVIISGLIINEVGLALGFFEPLSLLPLLIVSNCFVAIGGFLASLNGKLAFPKIDLSLEKKELLPSALFISLPVLSIVGTYFANAVGNSSILLVMIVATGSLFVISILYKKFLPESLYPFGLLMIALALVLQTSLISPYVWGGDIHNEYFVFQKALTNGFWDSNALYPDVLGRLNSMLSITILPSYFSIILSLDPSLFLKIVCPAIFSFVPVALFYVCKKSIGAEKAFIAAFFFMSINIFYSEILSSTRQIFAELFLILLIYLLTSKKQFSPKIEFFLFSILGFGLIVSHYALAELFLLFIALAFVIGKLIKRPINLALNKIALFTIVLFLWYVYTSNSAAFQTITDFGTYLISQVGNFFDPSSRGTGVLIGLGLEQSPSIWNTLSRIFAYLTEFMIIAGFIALAFKRSRYSFERVYLLMSFFSVSFLFALIGVPGLANTFNMSRFYQVLLMFLVPLFIAGGDFVIRFLHKSKSSDRLSSILLIAILVPYFFFQTGLVYEITGNQSWSVPLSKQRMGDSMLFLNYAYVTSAQVSAVSWLNTNTRLQQVNIFSDVSGAFELRSYGGLPYFAWLTNVTANAPNGIVYLSYLSVVDGIVVSDYYDFNTTQLSYTNDISAIYSNGYCQIYSNQ